MAVKDIILLDNDLSFVNGDFDIQESDQQSIELIIDSWVGHWKQFPLCGVGIDNFVKSSGQQLALKRTISVQLEADGMINVDILSNSGELLDLTISAERNE